MKKGCANIQKNKKLNDLITRIPVYYTVGYFFELCISILFEITEQKL